MGFRPDGPESIFRVDKVVGGNGMGRLGLVGGSGMRRLGLLVGGTGTGVVWEGGTGVEWFSVLPSEVPRTGSGELRTGGRRTTRRGRTEGGRRGTRPLFTLHHDL